MNSDCYNINEITVTNKTHDTELNDPNNAKLVKSLVSPKQKNHNVKAPLDCLSVISCKNDIIFPKGTAAIPPKDRAVGS